MAPARKRGAKGAKSKSELSLGDLVLAKVKGFPAWPAKISRPEDWDRAPDPKKYFVQFYGTEEIAFVAPVDIQAFTSESKKKLLARCQGKTVKYFAQAVREIGEAFEELQQNNSSAVRDDTDRASGGCEAPSNDGVEDDAMEVDPKDGTDGDETSKEVETRSLNEHGSGLERCSQKNQVEDCLNSETSMACESNDRFLKVTSSKPSKNSNNDVSVLEEVKLSPNQDNSLCLKEKVCDDNQGGDVICTGDTNVVTTDGNSDACKNEVVCDADGDYQNGNSSSKPSSSAKISDRGKKVANGHKTDRTSSGLKRIVRGTHEVRRSLGKLQSDSNNCFDSTKSENAEDGRTVRTSGGSSLKIESPDLEPKSGSANKPRKLAKGKKDTEVVDEAKPKKMVKGKRDAKVLDEAKPKKTDTEVVDEAKPKKMVKDKKDTEVVDEAQKEAQGSSREQGKSETSSGKKIARIRPAKNDADASHPAKRSKHDDLANELSKTSRQAARNDDPSCFNGGKMKDKPEVKQSTSCLKTENSAPKVRKPSSYPDDIDAPPQNKRRRRAPDITSDISASHSDSKSQKESVGTKSDALSSMKTKPPPTQLHSKRRAVRIFDEDDEEEPKTPVHGGSSSKVDASSCVSDRLKNTNSGKDGPGHNQPIVKEPSVGDSGDVRANSPKECLTPVAASESVSPNPAKLLRKKLEKETDAHIPHSPGKVDFEKASSEDTKHTPISPKASPPPDDAHKPMSGPPKGSRPSKISGVGNQKKTLSGSSKSSGGVSDALNHSQNQAVVQRSRQSSSVERPKSTPVSNVQDNISAHATENALAVNNSLSGERLEAPTDDKLSSFVDSKISDSSVSMKNLLAVARAKRKEAHSQNSSRGVASSHLPFPAEVSGRSPGHMSSVQPFPYGPSSALQTDIQEQPFISMPSPSRGRRFSLNNRSEAEEFEEKRVSSERRPAGGSLSGGTEAAVARDAFEGMLETLSRTKESISRATRLAVECAKYGIANEVVELLIRKLEGEPTFHRKVDLFFLVDSITQCSHSHKGIAEASYIPAVQAALPRLLGAAAPPGSAARENRRQCLKVLRLWVERKVLPESLLRPYMDDIGASNDDSSAGFFLRRPSRAERAVDDPIREMEGMLVDEYGSNATFQLPGLLTCHVFEEDEEDDFPSTACKDIVGGSLEPVHVTGEPEASTPTDRRHCILEDVDGELEMEDVSGHPKDERSLFADGTFASQRLPDEIVEAASNSEEMVGSPPLPCDSPPPTPPLPSSPIPPPSPPPPPCSPSSPPPPPPSPLPSALHQHTLPHVPHQSSLPPQPSMVQQQLHPPQLLVTSPPKPTYQQQLVREYTIPNGSQPLPTAGTAPHGGHIEVGVRKDVYPQQSPGFALAGISNSSEASGYSSSRPPDYGSQELFVNSQSSQSNQQFQPGNGSFTQRAFHPAPVPQAPSTHYLYPNPAGQQHQQNPYPQPYSRVNHSDGSRRYGTDEQWRMSTGELNADNQRVLWMNGGRAPSCSGPPLSHEGHFRPPLEMMASASNVGFQPPAPKTLPAGAPIPGHGVSQTLPSVSDMSAHSYWRPS